MSLFGGVKFLGEPVEDSKKLKLYLVAVGAPFLPIITWLPVMYGFNFNSIYFAYSVLVLVSFIGASACHFLKRNWSLSIMYFVFALPASWFITIIGACYVYGDCL